MVDAQRLKKWAMHAISPAKDSVINVMGEKSAAVQQDIPAAMEMYSILQLALEQFHPQEHALEKTAIVPLQPGILIDSNTRRLLVIYPIGTNELSLIAFFTSEKIRSASIKSHQGLLVYPFLIEETHLLPDWYAGFFINNSEKHCIPILQMASISSHFPPGADEIEMVLQRMAAWGLPVNYALTAIRKDIGHKFF